MERRTILWSLTVFFGASVTFQAIKSATAGSPTGVSIGIQLVALALMVLAIVLVVRRKK